MRPGYVSAAETSVASGTSISRSHSVTAAAYVRTRVPPARVAVEMLVLCIGQIRELRRSTITQIWTFDLLRLGLALGGKHRGQPAERGGEHDREPQVHAGVR